MKSGLLLLLAGLVAGAAMLGYWLGAAGAHSEAEAAAARNGAARVAEPRGYARGFRRGVAEGGIDGRGTGARQARASGARLGAAAGAEGVSAMVDALQAAQDAENAARSKKLAGGRGVLVVGDSMELLTGTYLRKYLPSQPLTINAVGGYSSPRIFGLFEQSFRPSHSVIVFDAGTNDAPVYPQILAAQLRKVAARIGDRCMVVPTIKGLPVNGVTAAGKNRVIRAFAESRPGTQMPDWASEANDLSLLQPDGLHPRPAGADRRAQIIAEAVQTCLDSYSDLVEGGP